MENGWQFSGMKYEDSEHSQKSMKESLWVCKL